MPMFAPKWPHRVVELAQHLKAGHFDCRGAECSGPRRAWRRISNGAGSIRLDGLCYCFPECFERRLQQRFLEMQAAEIPRPRPPHRVPLGLLMLSRGDLNNTQLRQALEAQRQNGKGRIGEWIQRLGYAREVQVTGALALQWSCPVIKSLPQRSYDYMLPLPLLRRFRMVPVKFVSATRVFHIAFAGDIEYRALLAIEKILDCKTEVCLTSSAAFESMLEDFERLSRRNDKTIEGARPSEEMTRIALSYATKLKAEEIRIVACGEYIWLRIKDGREFTNLLFEGRKEPRLSETGSVGARATGF